MCSLYSLQKSEKKCLDLYISITLMLNLCVVQCIMCIIHQITQISSSLHGQKIMSVYIYIKIYNVSHNNIQIIKLENNEKCNIIVSYFFFFLDTQLNIIYYNTIIFNNHQKIYFTLTTHLWELRANWLRVWLHVFQNCTTSHIVFSLYILVYCSK